MTYHPVVYSHSLQEYFHEEAIAAAFSAGSDEERADLATQFEALVQWVDTDKESRSPYLTLLARLREWVK